MFGGCKETIPIGKVCSLHSRIGWQALTKAEHMTTGEYMLITGTDFKNGAIDYTGCKYVSKDRYEMDPNIIIQNGDVLVTKDGTIGKVAVVKDLPKPATLNAGVFVVRNTDNQFLTEFIQQCLLSSDFQRFIESVKRGATIVHLNQEKFLKYELPVADLDFQHQFVDFVQQVDKSKAVCKQIFQLFDDLVKSRFIEMFGHWSDYSENQLRTMESICDVITDGSHYSPEDSLVGYPMLSVKDMGGSDFDYSDCKHVNEEEYQKLVSNGCKPLLGDVLIAKDGSFFKKGFVVSESKEQAILSSIAIIRPNKDVLNSDYLLKFLLSDEVLSRVSSMTSGTALKRVILKEFKKMKVPVPSLELQNEFANFVKQVDKSKFIQSWSLVARPHLFILSRRRLF